MVEVKYVECECCKRNTKFDLNECANCNSNICNSCYELAVIDFGSDEAFDSKFCHLCIKLEYTSDEGTDESGEDLISLESHESQCSTCSLTSNTESDNDMELSENENVLKSTIDIEFFTELNKYRND